MKYDESIKIYRDNLVTEAYAIEKGHREGFEKGLKEGLDKGVREGREKGIKEGIKEGLKEGRKEGRKEGIKEGRKEERYAIARNLKSLGMPLDGISKATGLSVDELSNL